MDRYATEDLSVGDIAEKVGVGERWLRELFAEQVGAPPQSVLLMKKLDAARQLIESSALNITSVAEHSGFRSLRRFNDAFRKRFSQTPRDLRRIHAFKDSNAICLAFRPPFDWEGLLSFFKRREIQGVEDIRDGAYRRLVQLSGAKGWISAMPEKGHRLRIQFHFDRPVNVIEVIARLKNMFDLDADPMVIQEQLSRDQKIRPILNQFPGLRIPGTWEGFESAVRAIVGQQISVKGAQTILKRLVLAYGEECDPMYGKHFSHFFPTPECLSKGKLQNLGLTKSRIQTLRALSKEVVNGLDLDGLIDEGEACQRLKAIKGIGAWTVQYIQMRSFRDPNVFMATDLEIKRQVNQLALDPEKWSPWKAYAALLLWKNSIFVESKKGNVC
jgi:AraC family transcriptional regulator of adaptative response / DNA-3-methyladenine glycosylase II